MTIPEYTNLSTWGLLRLGMWVEHKHPPVSYIHRQEAHVDYSNIEEHAFLEHEVTQKRYHRKENSEKRHPSRTGTSNMYFWSRLQYTQLYTQPNNTRDNGCNITVTATASTKREAAETEVGIFFFSHDKLQRSRKTSLLRIVENRHLCSKSAK